MNVMLQRHCARHIYVIPDGLRELMTDISREVLRSDPEDIYTFVADYLDALIITRENARVAARVVESLIDVTITTAALLEATGSTREEVDRIVNVIRKSFNKSLEEPPEKVISASEEVEEANMISNILHEAEVTSSQAEIAATIIQNAYRNFKDRKQRERELLRDMIDWRVAARSAIYLYRRTGVTNEEAHRAATLIKAAYKGYYTRRFMRQLAQDEQRLQQLPSATSYRSDERYYDGDGTQKAVRINYDTVIPHVDFDDSRRVIGEGDEMEGLEKVIPLTDEDSRIIEEKLQKEMGLSICQSVVSDIVTNAVQFIMRSSEPEEDLVREETLQNVTSAEQSASKIEDEQRVEELDQTVDENAPPQEGDGDVTPAPEASEQAPENPE